MPLDIEIAEVSAPRLEFGDPVITFADPRIGLTAVGPLSLRFGTAHKAQVRVGIVGPLEMIKLACLWYDRTQRVLPAANGIIQCT